MLLLKLLALASAAPPPLVVGTAHGEIVVDGVLDEADWANVAPATEFTKITCPERRASIPGRNALVHRNVDRMLLFIIQS